MDFVNVSEYCNYFKGAVNIGYIHKEGQGLLIDSGIDASTSKKVLKTLLKNNLPLDYVILTHAHTDHYGGAAFLKKEVQARLFAPPFEAAIMENPILEPIYLWNGAVPIKQLRNKFLEGTPITLDGYLTEGHQTIGPFHLEAVSLPGHSYSQMGILIENIFYAADGYFGSQALGKHKVPFIVDAHATIDSLLKIRDISFQGSLPGHGDFEIDINETIQSNLDCHEEIKQFLLKKVGELPKGVPMDEVMKKMFEHFQLTAKEIGQWLLYRTSFTAYVSSLIEDKEIVIFIHEYMPWLRKAE